MSKLSTWFQSAPNLAQSWLPPTELTQISPSRARSSLIRRDLSTSQGSFLDDRASEPILRRNEANVQKQLQRLLDAQSEGLNHELGLSGQDARSSGGNSSPGRQAKQQTKIMPVRQPRQQPVGLRAARRGIRDAMVELSVIKDQELEAHEEKITRCAQDLDQLQEWGHRRQALISEIEAIKASETQERVHNLREDDLALQEQINAVEVQLARLRDQQNAIRSELSRVTNAVDSQMSSYGQALQLVDNQIFDFLRQPKELQSQSKSTYLALPFERRTLKMASEHTRDERQQFQERRRALVEEREAIGEGLAIWQDVVHAVTRFERSLRRGIEAMKDEDSISETSRSSSKSQSDEDHSIHDIVHRMDDIIRDLDTKVRLAESRGWKLLVCCIGAELEAFQQGREVMQTTSIIANSTRISTPEAQSDYAPSEAHEVPVKGFDEETLHSSDATITGSGAAGPRPLRAYRDEEPDPDLLVSRTGDDTDPE